MTFEALERRQMFSGTFPTSNLPNELTPPATTRPLVQPANVSSSWTSLAGHTLQQVTFGQMANGKAVAFALGGDGAVYYRIQSSASSTSWGAWETLRGDVASISVSQGVGGKLQVVALGLDQSVYIITQAAANADSWTPWQGLGGGLLRQLAVAQNADGRAEIFAVGGDHALYSKWQNASGAWGGWDDLGGQIQSVSVSRGLSGVMNCVGLGLNGTAQLISQNGPNGGWGSWSGVLQGSGLGTGVGIAQMVASEDADGRFEMFALGSNNAVYHQWQHYDGTWSGWVGLGGDVRSIAAGLDGGRLQVLAIGWDSQVYINGQTTDNGNFGGWSNLGGSVQQMSVGSDANGAIRVLSLNTDQTMSYGGPTAQKDNTVTVTTRYGDELVVTASGTAVTVSVDQVGSNLFVEADNAIYTESVPAGGLFVYTRNGPDTVSINPSVTAQTTLDTIDNAASTVLSFGSSVITWADSTDLVYGTSTVHSISSFAGGVSKALGASAPDPSDSGATFKPNASLFGTGPVAADVNQGQVGDCWLMAAMGAIANTNPNVIRNSAVDLGDGTYAVELYQNGTTPEFIRVSNDMPVARNGWYSDGYYFAHPGPSGSIWDAVIEKAYVYFRSSANTYASIDSEGGEYVGEPMRELGLQTTDVLPSNTTDSTLFSRFTYDLNNGIPVAANIPPIGNLLVVHHCYSLVGLETVNGVHEYILRNPWGEWDPHPGENYQTGTIALTFAQMSANVGWMTEGVVG